MPLPPRFQEEVWRRIEQADAPATSLADSLRAWFALKFARPAFALAYVTVLILAGWTLGSYRASRETAQVERQLEARYVASIDPYQRSH